MNAVKTKPIYEVIHLPVSKIEGNTKPKVPPLDDQVFVINVSLTKGSMSVFVINTETLGEALKILRDHNPNYDFIGCSMRKICPTKWKCYNVASDVTIEKMLYVDLVLKMKTK